MVEEGRGNLTLTELSTQKELLLVKCKYNALSGCFILCTSWSVQIINYGCSKYQFELAQMVEVVFLVLKFLCLLLADQFKHLLHGGHKPY